MERELLGVIESRESLELKGRVRIAVWNPDGSLADELLEKNLICTAGVTQAAGCLMWGIMQDQAPAIGGASAITGATAYGALGSSSTAATTGDTQLGAELGRTTVAGATFAAGQFFLTFYFPTSASSWSITECGVFLVGNTAANSGLLLNHAVFTAVVKTSVQTATYQASFTL